MQLSSNTGVVSPEDYERIYRDARRMMQDILIAHAAICYKHMTAEQFERVQAEWTRVVRGKGWAAFFADDSVPMAPPKGWRPGEHPAAGGGGSAE